MNGLKKYFVIAPFCFLVVQAWAQGRLSVESQGLRAMSPDTVQRVQWAIPGEAGTAGFWDFSTLTAEDEPVVSTVEQLGEEIVVREAETSFYFQQKTTGNYYKGWENTGKIVTLDAPYNKLPLPLTVGQRYSTSYTASGLFTANNITTSINGTYTVEADAEGTVVLPDGRTLCEAIRVKSTDTYHETSCNTTAVNIEKYLWYVPYYTLPVFVTTQTAYEYTNGSRDTIRAAYYTTNAMPNAAIKSINDTTICIEQKVPLTATGAGHLFWRNVTEDTVFMPFTDTTITPLVTTTYVLKAQYAPCLQPAYDTITITVNEKPDLTLLPANTTLCQTDTINLQASTNYNLQWYALNSLGELAPIYNLAVAPDVTTKYIAVASNAPCMSNTATVTVSIIPVPTAEFVFGQADDKVFFRIPAPLAEDCSYTFDFGDHATALNQQEVVHQYHPGTYFATLTVHRNNTACTRAFTREIHVEEHKPAAGVILYPNPAKQYINVVTSSGIYYYRIIHLSTGTAITESLREGDETSLQIAIQQLHTGLYILQLQTHEGRSFHTFVKSYNQ